MQRCRLKQPDMIICNFNSCIPCGVQLPYSGSYRLNCISIHASRVGCDFHDRLLPDQSKKFQFMHPVWDATARFRYYLVMYTIFCVYILFSYTIISNYHLNFLLFECESPSIFMCTSHSHLNHNTCFFAISAIIY